MKHEDVPVGTIGCVGHPGNGVIVRKVNKTDWIYLHSGEVVLDFDIVHKSLRALWMPGYITTITRD